MTFLKCLIIRFSSAFKHCRKLWRRLRKVLGMRLSVTPCMVEYFTISKYECFWFALNYQLRYLGILLCWHWWCKLVSSNFLVQLCFVAKLTLKAPITTAADDIYKYFFIVSSPEPKAQGELLPSANVRRLSSVVRHASCVVCRQQLLQMTSPLKPLGLEPWYLVCSIA